MNGEGLIRGAMFVVGDPDQGILHTYLEQNTGEEVDFKSIEAAMRKIVGAKLDGDNGPPPGEDLPKVKGSGVTCSDDVCTVGTPTSQIRSVQPTQPARL